MTNTTEIKVETLAEDSKKINLPKEKQVKNKELIAFLFAAFFYTMITGMVGSYRQEFLSTFIGAGVLTEEHLSLINSIVNISGYFISFGMALVIDRSRSKMGKFRPLILIVSVPLAIVTSLSFYLPNFLSDSATKIIVYFCVLFIVYGGLTAVGNSVNMVAMVMSTDDKERNSIMSWRSIVSAVGNSAPLVVVLVIGMLRKPGLIKNDEMMYLVSAIICSVVGMITMLLGVKVIRERTTYDKKPENPFKNIKSIVTNKHAILVIISEFVKSFRGLASYMMPFLAIIFFGKSGQTLFFGICTGVGTFVGMFIIKALMKKYSERTLYICSGIYSVCINCLAFLVGYFAFSNPSNVLLTILFFLFMFLVGFQYGASNLLPTLFGADIIEEIEAKTGKRNDASYTWIVGLGGSISGIIVQAVAPILLYRDNLIGYLPHYTNTAGVTVYPENSLKTALWMLAFYTIFHGICMLAAGIPFFFYDLTGEKKKAVHEAALKKREEIRLAQEAETQAMLEVASSEE